MSAYDPITQVYRDIFDTIKRSEFADAFNESRMIDLTRGDTLPTQSMGASDFPTFVLLIDDMDDTNLKATSSSASIVPLFKAIILTDKFQIADTSATSTFINPLLFKLFQAIFPLIGGAGIKGDGVLFGTAALALDGINISRDDDIFKVGRDGWQAEVIIRANIYLPRSITMGEGR